MDNKNEKKYTMESTFLFSVHNSFNLQTNHVYKRFYKNSKDVIFQGQHITKYPASGKFR